MKFANQSVDTGSSPLVSLEKTIEKWFEEIAEDRGSPSFGDVFKGLELKYGKRGTREFEARGRALRALYSLDKKRHAAGLPLFSVLIRFEDEPPSALVNLLRELGLIKEGQTMEEIIWVIKEQRHRTWNHYFPLP